MRRAENVSLAPLTTIGLGGPARTLVTAETPQDVLDVVRAADAAKERLLVLGGGSNLVVGDAGFDGTVLRIATRGIERVSEGEHDLVTVAGGESWDGLVATLVEGGYAGVECLGGIPGLVGAVPMQNVGAYGQDVSETIDGVHVWDRHEGRAMRIDRDACRFAYRSSMFRGSDRWVILSVTFRLHRSGESRPIKYAELSRALGVADGATAPTARVRETVIALRRGKGMVVDAADPDTRSAGSFFTNPIVDEATLGVVRERAASVLGPGEKMPAFPEAGGRTKLSAGWLIERAGFHKGFTKGRAAVSSKHALALVTREGATTEELVALARVVRDGVRARFGVTLENEPVFVGVSL